MSTAGASGDACSTRIIALLSAAAAGSAATRRMATRPVPTAILDTRVLIEAFLLCTVFVQPCRPTVQGGSVICQVFVHTSNGRVHRGGHGQTIVPVTCVGPGTGLPCGASPDSCAS